MLYLSRFVFPDAEREGDFFIGRRKDPRTLNTSYDSFYPFGILSARGLETLTFEPLTILYGGNGCGKSTALNVMAEALSLPRDALYNRSPFFEGYTALCRFERRGEIPENSRIITSDDVFDFMLNLRSLNQGIDQKREDLFDEYNQHKRNHDFRLRSMADYEQLKALNDARSKTRSKYVRERLPGSAREHSNGESASLYFQEKLGENGLYLLDEPENSLSPARQQELAQFLEDSVRFFGCQLIIATHSPFLLALRGARIYDLDANPPQVKRWTQLANIQSYWTFFQRHAAEFANDD